MTTVSPDSATKGSAISENKFLPLQPLPLVHNTHQTTNGTKKADWADSDDDDEFFASLVSSDYAGQLESRIAAKDGRITDLITTLEEKEAHILELLITVESQKGLIYDLQVDAKVSAVQVGELKKENQKQFLHVQKLVAEVDEKDRRIAQLETEVDEFCATIAALDADDSATQTSSLDISTGHNTHQVADQVEEKTKADEMHTTIHVTPSIPQKDPANHDPATSVSEVSPGNVSENGPAVIPSELPVFATAATIKRTAPPPPAPKLKMAIDFSKFAKPAPKLITPKKPDSATVNATEDGPAPNIDPHSDIRTKSRHERMLFGKGPKVQVKMGTSVLAVVPKYVLMQCSHKAFTRFTNDPSAATFEFPASSMNPAAAVIHLDWMKNMTSQGRVWSVTLHIDPKFDDKNLQICRASRVLGLNNMYVGHFTRTFCDRIRTHTESYEFMSKVAILAYPENDPIYDCLASNLASMRGRNIVKKPETLELLLDKYPQLKAKVTEIEDRMHSTRHASEKVEKVEKGKKAEKGESGVSGVNGTSGVKGVKGTKGTKGRKGGKGHKVHVGKNLKT